jgi:hypothetical protein
MVGRVHAPELELALRVAGAGMPTPFQEAQGSPFESGGPDTLCLNTVAPSVEAAVVLAARAPDLAALLLVRRLAVAAGELGEKLDLKLTECVLARAGISHATVST